jgi:excinuclease UvrABC ATPase subunit
MLEQFARLNAGTQTINAENKVPLLDKADLCAVLAKLEGHHSWYIYAMIDQRRSYNMELLHTYLEQHVRAAMLERKFRSKLVTPVEFAIGVTKAVVYSHFHPKGKCGKCNGIGRIGTSLCTTCTGTGTKEHKWTEKLKYGFPFNDRVSRKWYEKSCIYYDRLVESLLVAIQDDLRKELIKLNRIEKAYRRDDESSVNESLFDDL